MKNNNSGYLFTSESVAPGHPDKLCDALSDSILDSYLTLDPMSKVAVECMAIPNRVIIAGEVRGPSIPKNKIEEIARNTIKNIGYNQEQFHWEKVNIDVNLNNQSPDIAMGVDASDDREEGAGDQGIMFGFACNETKNLMPATIYYAHKILKVIFDAIKIGKIQGLGPDAKSQITLEYDENKRPLRATKIVVSIQHSEKFNQQDVKNIIRPYVMEALPEGWMCDDENFLVNPTGRFVIGGPVGDTGLTGRKIIVDTYGGAAPHGGGAFSGKDPSKVDRSASYAARYVAKNIVASGLAEKCTIQISYAIGVAKPLSIFLNTHGTSEIPNYKFIEIIDKIIDLRPKGIRTHLELNKPIYLPSSSFGHFGREADEFGNFSWEKTDRAELIKGLLSK